MKTITLLSAFLLMAYFVNAQSNVGIGTLTPNSSAILDVSSISKGMLTPRMTTAQRNAIASPAKGLMVFDTDANALYLYNGSSWQSYLPGGGGSLTLPFTNTGSYNTAAFQIINQHATTTVPTLNVQAATGHAIQGISSSNFYSGIYGENSGTGKGVSGLNTATGHGVHARGADGTALFADIPDGTGTAGKFKQTNIAGKALEVEGNVRIFGGNTTPGVGKVLTSDANGNATWQISNINNRVAFCVRGIMGGGAEVLTSSKEAKVHFEMEEVDLGNDYNASLNAPASEFIVPVSGVYHLNTAITFNSSADNFSNSYVQIIRFTNGVKQVLARSYGSDINYFFTTTVTGSFYLQATDSLWVEVWASTDDNSTFELARPPMFAHFSGVLEMPL